jgi:hypothetical protein
MVPDILKETKTGARIAFCWRSGVWDWRKLFKHGFRAVKI